MKQHVLVLLLQGKVLVSYGTCLSVVSLDRLILLLFFSSNDGFHPKFWDSCCKGISNKILSNKV